MVHQQKLKARRAYRMCWWSINKEKGKKEGKRGPEGPLCKKEKRREKRERRRGKEEREKRRNGLEFNRGDLRCIDIVYLCCIQYEAQRARA